LVCSSSRLAFSNRSDRTFPPWGRQTEHNRAAARATTLLAHRGCVCRTAAHGPAYVRLNAADCANDNAPSADRIVCRGRAGERVAPPRVSISDSRQPTEGDFEAAVIGGPATSQGGISIRIASFRSSRRTWPAHCLLCQFGLARLVSAGRRADAPRLGTPPPGAISPDFHAPIGGCTQLPRNTFQCRFTSETGHEAARWLQRSVREHVG
jgi:hypothetical protein